MSRRKRKQQHENNGESSDSGDNSNAEESKCSHFKDGINLINLRKAASKKFSNECPDCLKEGTTAADTEELDSDDEIIDEPPKLWICLQCGYIACGRTRNQHALRHSEVSRSTVHCLVVDTQQWTAWCYKCDEEITTDTKNAMHRKKLIEVTEQLKRGICNTNSVVQPKPKLTLCQNETASVDNDKKKFSLDLPKVGGLTNLGNTCFFNAVMQCLAQTPYLIKVLDDLQVPEQTFVLPGGKIKVSDDEEVELAPIEGILDNNLGFTQVLRQTLSDMQNSNGQVFRPHELLNTLRRKTMQCTDGGQHDSHELLRHLLELVRNEDVKRYQSVILKETGLEEKAKRKNVNDDVRSRVKYYGNQANTKFLGPERVFRGELVSTLQCLECGHTSPRTEPFLDLSLPILIDKSIPPVLKRKNSSFDNSIELVSNNLSYTSKHESKKSHRKNENNQNGNNSSARNSSYIIDEKTVNKSEESDADVEDNIEKENASTVDVGESGYSSEKPSELASPVSLAEVHCNNKSTSTENSVSVGSDENAVCSDLTNDNSKSSMGNAADDDLEKAGKLTEKQDTPEKDDLSDKKDQTRRKIKLKINNSKEDDCTTKKFMNGFSDVTSNMSKLKISSPTESPRRYIIKEGDTSMQLALCLNQFTVLELLNENNKVGCEACTERVHKGKKGVKMVCTDSTKQYLISCVPAILILHLKRFQVQKFSSRKVGKHVSFPMVLDLSPVCKNNSKPKIYSLYGIVEHSGTMYGGHYVAYVKSRTPLKPGDPRWNFLPSKDGFENKNESSESDSESENDVASGYKTPKVEPPPGKWYYISDSRVSEVDEKTVLNSEAYLLFYERIL